MSAHLTDRQVLAELIRLGETILSFPFGLAPGVEFDLNTIAGDLLAAIRCPSGASRVHALGAGEGILFAALQKIVTGGSASQAELARFAFISRQALMIVRDRYFEIVRAEAMRRAAQFGD